MSQLVFENSKHANGGCIFADPTILTFAVFEDHYTWHKRDNREDNEILLLLTIIYEAGTF